ncbi:hypothetical protein BC832DRAFT_588752 [Gaertneriomyces semiglobifer]|nr:hypothetical protein BC832DRAFT_588752 [Gaertneriomyces semiglobifer]
MEIHERQPHSSFDENKWEDHSSLERLLHAAEELVDEFGGLVPYTDLDQFFEREASPHFNDALKRAGFREVLLRCTETDPEGGLGLTDLLELIRKTQATPAVSASSPTSFDREALPTSPSALATPRLASAGLAATATRTRSLYSPNSVNPVHRPGMRSGSASPRYIDHSPESPTMFYRSLHPDSPDHTDESPRPRRRSNSAIFDASLVSNDKQSSPYSGQWNAFADAGAMDRFSMQAHEATEEDQQLPTTPHYDSAHQDADATPLPSLKRRCYELRRQLDVSEHTQRQSEELILKLQTQLADIETELASKRRETGELRDKESSLMKQLETTVLELKQQANQSKASSGQYRQMLEQQSSRTDALSEDLRRKEEDLAARSAALEALQEELQKVVESNEQLQQDMERLEADVEEARHTAGELESENVALKERVEELETAMDEMARTAMGPASIYRSRDSLVSAKMLKNELEASDSTYGSEHDSARVNSMLSDPSEARRMHQASIMTSAIGVQVGQTSRSTTTQGVQTDSHLDRQRKSTCVAVQADRVGDITSQEAQRNAMQVVDLTQTLTTLEMANDKLQQELLSLQDQVMETRRRLNVRKHYDAEADRWIHSLRRDIRGTETSMSAIRNDLDVMSGRNQDLELKLGLLVNEADQYRRSLIDLQYQRVPPVYTTEAPSKEFSTSTLEKALQQFKARRRARHSPQSLSMIMLVFMGSVPFAAWVSLLLFKWLPVDDRFMHASEILLRYLTRSSHRLFGEPLLRVNLVELKHARRQWRRSSSACAAPTPQVTSASNVCNYLEGSEESSTSAENVHEDLKIKLTTIRRSSRKDGLSRLDQVERILRRLREDGFPHTALEYNCYMEALILAGRLKEARAQFVQMKVSGVKPDRDSFEIMCKCETMSGAPDAVFLWISEIKAMDLPNVTYSAIVKPSITTSGVSGVERSLDFLKRESVELDKETYEEMIIHSTTLRKLDVTMLLLGRMLLDGHQPSRGALNRLINAHAREGDLDGALQAINSISSLGFKPSAETFLALFLACERSQDATKIESIWTQMSTLGISVTPQMYQSIIKAYGASGETRKMRTWFARMTDEQIMPSVPLMKFITAVHYRKRDSETKYFIPLLRKLKDNCFHGVDFGVKTFLARRLHSRILHRDVSYAKWLYDVHRRLGLMPPLNLHGYLFELSACTKDENATSMLLDLQNRKHLDRELPWFDGLLERILEDTNVPVDDCLRYFVLGSVFGFRTSDAVAKLLRRRLRQSAREGGLVEKVGRFEAQLSTPLKRQMLPSLKVELDSWILQALLVHDEPGAAQQCRKLDPLKLLNIVCCWRNQSYARRLLRLLVRLKRQDVMVSLLKGMLQRRDPPPEIRTYNLGLDLLAETRNISAFAELWQAMEEAANEGVLIPDEHSFLARIKLSSNTGSLPKGTIAGWSAIRNVAELNIASWGKFISMLLKAEQCVEAHHVLTQMIATGIRPSIAIFNMLMSYHAKRRDSKTVKALDEQRRQLGVQHNVQSYTTLMSLAARTGDISEAKSIYATMRGASLVPDSYSFTVLITAHAIQTDVEGAMSTFEDMVEAGVAPNLHSYNAVLSACARDGDVMKVGALLERMRSHGFEPDASTYNTLWQSYASAGVPEEMNKAYAKYCELAVDVVTSRGDIGTVNKLLKGYARAGDVGGALALFQDVRRNGITPDVKTFTTLIEAHARVGDAMGVGEWWARADESKCPMDAVGISVAIAAATAAGHSDLAWLIFERAVPRCHMDAAVYNIILATKSRLADVDGMHRIVNMMIDRGIRPSLSTWSCVSAGLSKAGRASEAVDIWKAVTKNTGVAAVKAWNIPKYTLNEVSSSPDLLPLIAVTLDACGFGRMLEDARDLWSQLPALCCQLNDNHLASYVECLARCGHVEEAYQVVSLHERQTPKPGIKTYGTLVSMLLRDGRNGLAFDVMCRLGEPNQWLQNAILKRYDGVAEWWQANQKGP